MHEWTYETRAGGEVVWLLGSVDVIVEGTVLFNRQLECPLQVDNPAIVQERR